MLNRDYTSGIQNAIRNSLSLDFTPTPNKFEQLPEVVSKGLENWDNAMRKKAYVDALQTGDQEKIDKALASYDADAYQNVLKDREKRQQELDDIAAQRDFQREMMDAQLKNNFALENMRNQNAMRLAQYRAGLAAQNGGNGQAPLNPFDKKRIEKAASDMDANITRAQEMKATFEQANNALQNINTGTPLAMLTKNRPLFSNADEEAFDSAAAKSIDMVRKAGTGPMTDADARRYEKASIDRGKSKEANQLLIDSGMIAADNAIAKEELRADWVANGGRLGDFDKEWRSYLNSNPIFGKDGKINKGRQDAFNWFYNPEQRQQPSLANYNTSPQNNIQEGAVIEDANGNRMVLRGGQWQKM